MRKKSLVLVLLACITVCVNAQIKVFTGGNVSIGSSIAPPNGFKLQLIGNSVFSYSTSSIISSAFIRGINLYSTDTTPDYTWYGDTATGIFHPLGNNIGFTIGGNEKIRIDSSGNLGIGTSSPVAKLHVESSSGEAFRITQNYNAAGAVIDMTGVSANYNYAFLCKANSILTKAIVIQQDTTENFYVLGNGKTFIRGWDEAYDLYVNGSTYCTRSWEAADNDLITNVSTISNPVMKLKKLRGVHFDYNTEANPTINFGNPSSSFGVIAEEVDTVLPELVKVDSSGYKDVNYSGFIPILIEAIKVQQEQIAQLQNDLDNCCSKGKSNDNTGEGQKGDINNLTQNNSDYPLLYQNTPNPFNLKTEIKYYLPLDVIKSSIMIFDMQGSLLKTYTLTNRGSSSIEIYGGELKPGMYMYSLISDGKEIDTKKMILTE